VLIQLFTQLPLWVVVTVRVTLVLVAQAVQVAVGVILMAKV
jgi:hypothetical protein